MKHWLLQQRLFNASWIKPSISLKGWLPNILLSKTRACRALACDEHIMVLKGKLNELWALHLLYFECFWIGAYLKETIAFLQLLLHSMHRNNDVLCSLEWGSWLNPVTDDVGCGWTTYTVDSTLCPSMLVIHHALKVKEKKIETFKDPVSGGWMKKAQANGIIMVNEENL